MSMVRRSFDAPLSGLLRMTGASNRYHCKAQRVVAIRSLLLQRDQHDLRSIVEPQGKRAVANTSADHHLGIALPEYTCIILGK